MRMEGLAVVAELIDRFEADTMAAALRSEGIPVTINEDTRRAMLGGGILGAGTHGADPVVEILVPAERLEEAQEILDGLTEQSLPPEFHNDVWQGSVTVNSARRRRAKRTMVLVPIYALFACIVVVLLIVAVTSMGS